ncbi:MAG TPA: GNAT family N-acetyltransferase [Blastocatellia bacterium]|nr:GNAT family N-acetyltransferase [Blastocatellia bacterium]
MLEIRRIRAADASAIRALYLNLLHHTFNHFPPDGLEKYAADWTAPVIAARAEEGRFLMLGAFADDGEAVGLLFAAPPDSGVGTIIWLGIDEFHRGAGVGRRLMRAAFDAYRQQGCHKVKVYTETEAARDFYLRLGMALEGFHPRHWWQVDFWSLGGEL